MNGPLAEGKEGKDETETETSGQRFWPSGQPPVSSAKNLWPSGKTPLDVCA